MPIDPARLARIRARLLAAAAITTAAGCAGKTYINDRPPDTDNEPPTHTINERPRPNDTPPTSQDTPPTSEPAQPQPDPDEGRVIINTPRPSTTTTTTTTPGKPPSPSHVNTPRPPDTGPSTINIRRADE